MAYFTVEDFAAGIDVRKSEVTAKAGTLRMLENGFVNAGGEIEKRRRFALLGNSVGTFGLGAVANGARVFVTPGGAAPSVPALVTTYTLTPNPALTGGVVLSRILDVETFGSKLYVVALFSNGTIRHFYDGVQIDQPPAALGRTARTHKTKMYSCVGNNLYFSGINVPNRWTDSPNVVTGEGLIDVTSQDAGAPDLVAIEPYYDNLALLGRRSIQLWTMDADPSKSQFVQALANIGIVAHNACARYGTGDVLFLSTAGIRSLRARNSSNAAEANDIGSPIDTIIRERLRTLDVNVADRVIALVDPHTGQWWLCWGDTIYVLSYFAATKVTAWSMYKPGFEIEDATVCGSRVLLRSGGAIYVAGSLPTTGFEFYDGGSSEYDSTSCTWWTPMMDGGKPATEKVWQGIDAAVEGTWDVYLCPDPLNPTAWELVATLDSPTYSLQRIPYQARSTHIAVKMVSKNTGPARVGALVIHHEEIDAK